jgi:hypothetical protein
LADVKGVTEILQGMRENSEKSFVEIFDSALKLAQGMSIEVEKPRIAKRSVYRTGVTVPDK